MISFNKLWLNYPGDSHPCDSIFKNQCAIKMGVALQLSDVNLITFKGERCYKNFNHKPKHILRAEQLANWMRNNQYLFGECIGCESKNNADFRSSLYGKKGIIFIKDGWKSGGDHIDLWNETKMKAGNNEWLTRGTQLWFWDLKTPV